jgi:hypothetical protein
MLWTRQSFHSQCPAFHKSNEIFWNVQCTSFSPLPQHSYMKLDFCGTLRLTQSTEVVWLLQQAQDSISIAQPHIFSEFTTLCSLVYYLLNLTSIHSFLCSCPHFCTFVCVWFFVPSGRAWIEWSVSGTSICWLVGCGYKYHENSEIVQASKEIGINVNIDVTKYVNMTCWLTDSWTQWSKVLEKLTQE